MSLAKKGFVALLYSYVGVFFEKSLNFFSAFFVIRLLTVEEYGVYSLLQSFVIFGSILNFGIPKIINRYYPEYEAKEDWYILKKLLKYSIVVRCLTVAIISIAFYTYTDTILVVFNVPVFYSESFQLFCLVIFLYSCSNTFECILLSQLQYAFHRLFKIPLHFFQVCLIYYFLTNGYGVLSIAWVWVMVYALTSVVFSAKALHRISGKKSVSKKIISFPFKRIIRYGSIYFLSTMGGFFLTFTVDIFFISYYLGSLDVGLYTFGAKISTLALTLSPALALQGIITNLLIRKQSLDLDNSNLGNRIRTYYKLLLFSNIPILLLAGIYAEESITYIFKEDYLDALFVVYAFLFFSLFTTIQAPLDPLIKIIEKPEILLGRLIFVFLKILLNIFLIPSYGINGALFATGIAMALSCTYVIIVLRKYVPLSFPWKSFFKFGINALGLFLVGFMLKVFITSFITLIICSVVSIASYIIFCYYNKGFNGSERQIFNKAIGRDFFVF